jgi:hypothetical protein
MPKKVTVTRKIELRFNITDAKEKNAAYETIKAWRDVACNGANMAISAMYSNLKGESVTYLHHKLAAIRDREFEFEDLEKKIQREKSKEEDKGIYEIIKKEKKDFFITTESAYYYRMLAVYYKDSGIPSVILGCISQQIAKDFSADKSDYLRHNQSLRTYKKNMPIPFTSQSIRQVRRSQNDKGEQYKDFTFTLFGLPLRTNFGRDRSNNYFLLNEAFSKHFLPDVIKDAQKQLSDWLLDVRATGITEQAIFNRGDLMCAASYESLEDDTDTEPKDDTQQEEHRFRIKATLSKLGTDNQPVVTEHNFLKQPCQIDKKPAYKIESNYKLCDSKIQVLKVQSDKDGGGKVERTKLILLASLSFDKEPWKLDPDKICYCELDPEIPIKLKIGNRQINIGNKEEFQYRRTGIQGAYRKHQVNLKFNNGGHGRQKKMSALDKYKNYEKDVIKDKIHLYTAEVVKKCKENNCKYIYLHIPKKPTDNVTDEEKFLIRNWSYGQIQSILEHKAERFNIEVIEYESA